MIPVKGPVVLVMALGLSGCLAGGLAGAGRTPVRWIVVEKRVGEVLEEGRVGDGQVDPQAIVLTMQPLYKEDLAWEVVLDPHDYYVEILEITPSTQAAPGETVSAKVRVGHARPNELYRLTARASQVGIAILGETQCTVRGSSPAAFRFTSVEACRAGIAIGVEKLE